MRSALVVGGSGGIGRAICQRLADDGFAVFVTYRTRPEAAETACRTIREAGGVAEAGFCDLTRAETVRACVDQAGTKCGPLGAVVFASGPSVEQAYVSQLSTEKLTEALQADVIGFVNLIQAALPVFRQQGGGAFVALSSVAVHSFPPKDILGGVPKSAVEMLCRAVAKEEGRFGIRANAVSPGFIEAGLGQKFIDELYTPDVWDRQRQNVPLRRFGQASEVADAVTFLASERASYVNGQTLRVDGGFGL